MSAVEAVGFLSGAAVMGYAVVALLFARFWRSTRDRLFAIFAGAFLLLALQRLALSLSPEMREEQLVFYVVRLIAYLLILWAIIDKNRTDAR
jgi:hypothetical protein